MCLKKLHKYTSKNYINIRLPQAGDAAPPPPANMRDWGGPAPGRCGTASAAVPHRPLLGCRTGMRHRGRSRVISQRHRRLISVAQWCILAYIAHYTCISSITNKSLFDHVFDRLHLADPLNHSAGPWPSLTHSAVTSSRPLPSVPRWCHTA